MSSSSARLLLESASWFGVVPAKASRNHSSDLSPNWQPRLLVLTARHPTAFLKNVEKHDKYLETYPGPMRDLGFSLATKREMMPHRQYCVTDGDT